MKPIRYQHRWFKDSEGYVLIGVGYIFTDLNAAYKDLEELISAAPKREIIIEEKE